jgi:hypothetical protein
MSIWSTLSDQAKKLFARRHNALIAATRAVVQALENRTLLSITAPTNLLPSPDSSPGGSPSILLGWQDNSDNEASFKIKRSTDGVNFSQIDTVGANVAAYSDAAITAGTHYWYEVIASNATEDSSPSNFSDAVEWYSSNVGTVTGGSASTDTNGVTTIVTAGGGIGGTVDDFRYDYRTLSGDGYIIAKVASVQWTNRWPARA